MDTTKYLTLMMAIAEGALLTTSRVSTGQEPPEYKGTVYPKTNLVVGHQVDPAWPRKPAGFKWAGVPGVAVDAQDRIWVINRGDVPVQIYTPDGAFIRAWGQGRFKAVHQIRFDRRGNVWISDTSLHTVQQFTPAGELLLTLGTPDQPGEDAKHFNKPTDMAISPTGDVFVTDGYNNNRVVHFDREGKFVKTWGKMGSAPGEFSLPHSIVMDSAGRLYVAERNNARIQVFDENGHLLSQFPQVMVPWTLLMMHNDEIFACGSSPMRWGSGPLMGLPPKDQLIMRFDTQGRVQQMWTFPLGSDGKEQPGELNWLHGMAIDSKGNVYLGDVHGSRVQKFVCLPRSGEATAAGGGPTR